MEGKKKKKKQSTFQNVDKVSTLYSLSRCCLLIYRQLIHTSLSTNAKFRQTNVVLARWESGRKIRKLKIHVYEPSSTRKTIHMS